MLKRNAFFVGLLVVELILALMLIKTEGKNIVGDTTRYSAIDAILEKIKQENLEADYDSSDTDDLNADEYDDSDADEKENQGPLMAVLITNSSGGQSHETLRVSGTDAYEIVSELGEKKCAAQEEIDIGSYMRQQNLTSCSILLSEHRNLDWESYQNEENIFFKGIQIKTLKKNNGTPVYCGALHIWRNSETNALTVVNVLPIEWYLPGVVGSEMPNTFAEEAQKTQAVCARSYTMATLYQQENWSEELLSLDFPVNSKTPYWNLEDTTNDQVYLSGPVEEQAITACQATRGEVLIQGQEIIKPHYYSTSWGEQADINVFSNGNSEYLAATASVYTEQEILQCNQDFLRKYNELNTSNTADYKSPWFRWSAFISLESLYEKLDQANKGISDLCVAKRGTGSYASELLITYQDGTMERINGAGTIRKILGNKETVYHLNDGSERTGLGILPSAFFALETEDIEKNGGIQIYGGGFGHGCGLSQYGAAQMAEKMYKYTEILSYYYENASVYEYY